MGFILSVVGIIVGAVLFQASGGWVGAVVGGLCGALASEVLTLRRRATKLENVVRDLWDDVHDPDRKAPQGQQPAAEPAGATDESASEEQPRPDVVRGDEPTVVPVSAADDTLPSVAPPATAAPPREALARERGDGSRAAPEAQATVPGDHVVEAIRNYFLGGNTVVRVGVLVLVFGVGLLAKYAIDQDLFPPELRLAAASAIALACLVLGWRFRDRGGFGVTLQGGGVGALYLTVFFGFKVYGLIPDVAAFVLMVLIAVFAAVLAVVQNAMFLALAGATFGFLAPLLVSSGGGRHVILFSHYLLMNAGIVAVTFFRPWRWLTGVGFLFTFGVATAWGVLRYAPENYGSTQPFLILFFLFYVAIAVFFALRSEGERPGRGFVNGGLVFGTPIVVFSLQASLVHGLAFGVALSALAMGLVYAVCAGLLIRHERMRPLVEAFVAIAIAFGTMAIPFALDDHRITAAAWALEGAGLVWFGVRQARTLSRLVGFLLQFAAGVAFAAQGMGDGGALLASSRFWGCALVAVGAAFAAFFLHRSKHSALDTGAGHVLLGWGLIWWYLALGTELEAHLPKSWHFAGFVAVAALTIALLEGVGTLTGWRQARRAALLALGYGLLPAAVEAAAGNALLRDGAVLSWAAVAIATYVSLRRQEGEWQESVLGGIHGALLWLWAWLLAHDLALFCDVTLALGDAWAAGAVVFTLAVFVGLASGAPGRWPLGAHRRAVFLWGALPLGAVMVIATVLAIASTRGTMDPLPYWPLVGPFDVAQGAALAALVWVWSGCRRFDVLQEQPVAWHWGIGALSFLMLNGVLVRTVHLVAEVSFSVTAMWRSAVLHTSISIFWTLLSLVTMILASRTKNRPLWVTAAALLGVVVVKLFLVDLSTLTAGAKIITFIVVGALLVAVGYFSPVPPAKEEAGEPDQPASSEEEIP